ncbi:MAG TPA: PilC/PilY family type IV pilus protein, partial [Thermoanaerobaculia bacterium]
MSPHRKFARGKALALAALAVLIAAGGRPALSDDVDLLRFTTAKPYVFFVLDTSASMTLSPAGQWVHANGDDPRSKLYQAKQVLYQVFQEVEDIHFGFAAMNQDKSAAASKHWLYYYTGALPGGWPINYPRPDPDGPVQFQAGGTVVDDVEGDLMTFGPRFDATGTAGSCASPLSLSTQTEMINRYSKTGDGTETKIWLRASGNKTYLLTVSRPGKKPDDSDNPTLGQNNMNIKFVLEEFSNCTTKVATHVANLDLKLWTDFLALDENVGSVNAPGGSQAGGIDKVAGFWDFRDILDSSSCGSGHPFSGKGWEGNYDGAANNPPASVAGSIQSTFDPYCRNAGDPATCYNLKKTTQFDPLGRPLDRGDLLPLDWRVENKDAFLSRLAPNQSDGTPDFRIASYFKDQPEGAASVLQLRDSGRSPLFGTGPSPLGKMVIDFRCWYRGEGNKCNAAAYSPGWESIASRYDREWGCRRPYLIVISDGGDSCPGENPCADTADLNSKSSVRTWVIAYGANCKGVGNPLSCMAQNGKGELLCPQNATDLKTELLKILGQIRQEARAFASAAVPSVQAIVEDKVFLTNFTPLDGKAVWDGHVHSFLKPIPVTVDGRPDANHPNHLWDAGEVMRTIQVSADPLGSGANQRRVYYSRDSGDSLLMTTRRLLDPTQKNVTPDDVRRDLWRAFEIPFVQGDTTTEAAAELRANTVIQKTLAVKSHTLTVVDPVTGKPVTRTIQYLLGDIFHSNPLVIGSPPNTLYNTANIHDYADFFDKHFFRRKMLLVGSNDGMLHAFDAGTFNAAAKKFNNGTGKELFAYIPRDVMPTVRRLSEGSVHQWGVDSTVTVADVFIDPKHTGIPTPADRQWRTVVLGGLREGGSGYYALDITQPDKLVTASGLKDVPQPDNGVPSCAGGDTGTENLGGCGPLPFPAALWEFNDSVRNAALSPVRLDEDANGEPDLAATWSIPNVGRIRLNEDGEVVEKFVMVVGGGFDPDNKTSPLRGTWLYMVDVETGQAIYKRRLTGAVPSEPAAVDTNQDGFLDRIYVGTTAGLMYRVDLIADVPNAKDPNAALPSLANKTVRGLDGLTYTVKRVPDSSWAPRVLFNANTNAGVPLPVSQARPIYFRPSVVFASKIGRFALAFGTGDREDLWLADDVAGRFYVFVDDTDDLPDGTVLDESRFQRITVASGAASGDYLLDSDVGRRGWYVELDANERLITDPFAL